jgi:mannose-6-phosphate isomerase-like protein (cupin superfamily)
MSAAGVIPPAGGEVVGDSPDRRVEILCEHDAVHATWSRFGPGRAGADLHVHRRHTDVFYVLAGDLTVALGPEGRPVTASAGALVRVPPLVVHGFRNDAEEELRYLNFHAPGQGFADYMRAIRDGRTRSYDQEPPPADGGRSTADAAIGRGAAAGEATVLADGEEIAIAEMSGVPEAPHVHDRHLEALYVLEGELALTAGGRELRAPAGSWAQVPPGVAHALSSTGPVRYLSVHAPGCGFGAFLRALDEDSGQAAGFDIRPAP